MRRVIIESPFGSDDPQTLRENIAYARACANDCVQRGEVPFASHLFFPQFMDDKDPAQRQMGIEMGYDFWEKADLVIFYMDKGLSPGMQAALGKAFFENKPYEKRTLQRIEPSTQPGGVTNISPNTPGFESFKPKPRVAVDLDKLDQALKV